jgi:glycosyltransferase involved in cell wall biosynthesis
MSKKVCMIFLRHTAWDDRIYYKEARILRDAGYDVHLICRLRDGAFTDMRGRAVGYPDESGQWHYDGMTFHGIPKRKGLFGKWLEYKDLVRVGLSLKADVYHCHESDIALMATSRIKRHLLKKTKFIFDSHEFWSGCWAYTIMGPYYHLILHLISQIEKHFLKYTDYLIASDVPTAGALQLYDLSKKVSVIYNSPMIHLIDSSNKFNKLLLPEFNKGKIVLCHEGTLNCSRKIDVIIDIIECLKDTCILYVIGGIKEPNNDIRLRVRKLKEEGNIIDTGWISYDSVHTALQPAQIGLVLLMNHPNYVTATPNKIFNYMSMGIPIIANDYPGLRDIIERCKCGILVDPSRLENYISAIQYLINHPNEAKTMGQNGKRAVLNEFSWKKQGEKLLSIYEELLNPKQFIK